MTVNFEVKGMLARLLATEDIVVEHRKVETACFNVQSRVLTLPLWEKASDSVYSMLVAHEVGHARETPSDDWDSFSHIPMQFVNVVEDARVEKLMKRRYNGLAKTFYSGYKELYEDDFFQVKNEDVSKFNLADRANLYFKIGNFFTLKFSEKEQEIVDLIAQTETFSDVLNVAEILYKYCKEETSSNPNPFDAQNFDKIEVTIGGGSFLHEGSSDEDLGNNQSFSVDFDSNSQTVPDQQSSNTPGKNTKSNNANGKDASNQKNSEEKEPEIRTMNTLQDKIRELLNNYSEENIYVEVPSVDLNAVIAKNLDVHSEINKSFEHQVDSADRNLFKSVDIEYKKFKTSAQKEVNYLVKEFECKKAADSYSRSSISRTGVLDCSRLHSYKYTEDLFKKITTLAEGKNHGLVFVLDWSGSMSTVMMDTVKQLFNLIWFCKKVSLPFEVYAFTNEWTRPSYDYATKTYDSSGREYKNLYQKRDGLIYIDGSFSLMNLLTNKVSTSVLEKQMINIWRLAYSFTNSYRTPYHYPARLSLSGTPLNESLVCLFEILPKFQRDNKLQKVQCIILTDGEAGGLGYYKELTNPTGTSSIVPYYCHNGENIFIRDRKLGTTYKVDSSKGNYTAYTHTLLQNLRDKFSSTNFIGIRVIDSRDAYRFVSLYHSTETKEYQKIMNDWRKLKSFSIYKTGYHAYFGISSNALSQDSTFQVSDNATKTEIKSAFVNSLKTKKTNKKILSEFISLIA